MTQNCDKTTWEDDRAREQQTVMWFLWEKWEWGRSEQAGVAGGVRAESSSSIAGSRDMCDSSINSSRSTGFRNIEMNARSNN